MSGERDDESFLARWSRRKQSETRRLREPEAQAALDERPPQVDTGAVPEPGPHADAAMEDDRPLPSLDDLTPDSDLRAFLEKRVPEELRRQALRRMWTLDPAISGFVEMAENQYDWNVPGGAPMFGDLDPGADLGALLAQATGAVTAPATVAGGDRSAVASLAADQEPAGALGPGGDDGTGTGTGTATGTGDLPETSATEPRGEARTSPDDGETGTADAPASGIDPDAQNAGSGLAARRHGRALPV